MRSFRTFPFRQLRRRASPAAQRGGRRSGCACSPRGAIAAQTRRGGGRSDARLAQGLTDIVPSGLLAIFDAEQLQELLGGSAITRRDIRAWRENTRYVSLREDEDRVVWLWEWLENDETCSDEQRSALFKFATGSTVLPPGGFPSLDHQFTIQAAGGDADSCPKAYTCFNTLLLPRYSSCNELQAKVKIAIGVAEYDREDFEAGNDGGGGAPLDEEIQGIREGETVVDSEDEAIGDEGVAMLAAALCDKNAVTEIYLGGNQIGDTEWRLCRCASQQRRDGTLAATKSAIQEWRLLPVRFATTPL